MTSDAGTPASLEGRSTTDALTDDIVAAIAAVPGVTGLSPTLSSHARSLGQAVAHRTLPTLASGVTVQLHDDRASVTADVALALDEPAVDTAVRAQRAVAQVLAAHGVSCESVRVSILDAAY